MNKKQLTPIGYFHFGWSTFNITDNWTRTHSAQDKGVWLKMTSKWNHLEVAGSILKDENQFTFHELCRIIETHFLKLNLNVLNIVTIWYILSKDVTLYWTWYIGISITQKNCSNAIAKHFQMHYSTKKLSNAFLY